MANALNGLFLPKIARISVGDNRDDDLLTLMIRVGRIQIYIIGLIIVGFIVLGNSFIALWLGKGYEVLYPCTVLIILPSYINLPQQIANTTMTVENHIKSQALVFVAMALINVVLSLLLAGKFGVLGACISIFIAYMFRVIAMNYQYKTKLKINISEFFKQSFLKILPWQVLTAFMGFGLFKVVSLFFRNFYAFCIVGALIVSVYFVLMYAFVMNEEEKSIINRIVRRGTAK